jgi:hypothetical protein
MFCLTKTFELRLISIGIPPIYFIFDMLATAGQHAVCASQGCRGASTGYHPCYSAVLGEFGDSTSALSEEPSAFNLLSWLKAHVEKLPSFVGGAVDFGALARATNFAKMLAHGGCPRAKGI